ncbi:DNA-3-methyladenine glycosylase family protein [Lampropedia cohaerens]|uniref:DNA-3-methyladenine glycosylase family protein n=1 Tax=Lampropedia cohaerens TaxID=1610491 RepID=UPI000A07CE73|nr:DNA-3-methyladenine glycosylase [Lampropedia cohaerens]
MIASKTGVHASNRAASPQHQAVADRATTVTQPDLPAEGKPDYWDEACRHLVKKDRILRRIIPRYPGMSLQSRGDAFETLARSIVGQQISTKAAAAVWARVAQGVAAGAAVTPSAVLALQTDALRALGLSQRKAEYLRDLAHHFDQGLLNVQDWPQLEDEAIIAQLVAVRGIGRWTAEMFLMFHMLRPNVLPLDDAGLIQGISRNYFSGEPVTRSDAREVAQAWKPYRTVATWYMWRSLAEPQAY